MYRLKLFRTKRESLVYRFFLVALFCLGSLSSLLAQPFPPINVQVLSYANRNRVQWSHHPLNPDGYVVNYEVCRGDSSGATAPIGVVSAGGTLRFDDSEPDWAYEKEFFYTVRAVGNDASVSEHSEEVMRFLPRAGVGKGHTETSTISSRHYGNWDPYPGQWTDVYSRISTSPIGGSSYHAVTYGNRQIVRRAFDAELPPGGPYYIEARIGRPDWWGANATGNFYTSYSSSLPFYVDAEVPFEDNASSTYFNSSPNRVMTEIIPTGGIKAALFSGHGGGFWRMRQPVRVQAGLSDDGFGSRINAPCRAEININPGQMAAGRAAAEVRVADDYGNEIPSVVLSESTAGPWVTSFVVHFIASQDYRGYENYWIYYANPAATPASYGFSNNLTQTSQFQFSPWYSRKIVRGTTEWFSTAASAHVSSPLGSPADDDYIERNMGFVFPFFEQATDTVYISTNGYISLSPHIQPMNTWAEFTGPSTMGGVIAPFWCNLMVNDSVPSNAGFYYELRDNGNPRRRRGRISWRANRFNAVNEQYVFQVMLYWYGDIMMRYDTINYNALWETPSGSGDNPINIAPHHTAGISASDGLRWGRITDDSGSPYVTPLYDGIGRNAIHQFQSCYAWLFDAFTDPTNQPAMAGATTVAHFDSRIFDGRSTDPTWTSVEYEITGSGLIDLYVRTAADVNFPDWDLSHLIASDLPAGVAAIPLTLPNDRYLQYRVVFKKSIAGDDPVLRRIKFSVGYITIDETTNEFDISDVSQGQTFAASMTFSNFYSNPVNSEVASLVFDPLTASQTWVQTTPHASNVAFEASATLGFNVTVDQNSGNLDNWTYIDGYLEAGDGLTTLVSATSISRSRYRIREKAGLSVDYVTAPFDKVNKGQGGIPVSVRFSNTSPFVPLILNTTALKFNIGNYSWNPEFVFAPAEQGLFGQYFNSSTANPPTFPDPAAATRVDPEVNFNWVAAAPLPEVGANYFGVRWSGYIIPEFSETYTIYFFADDGVRVWVNDVPVISSWISSTFERSGTIDLVAGNPASIVIEYYERTGNARAELSWESLSQPKQIIPSFRLKPANMQIIPGGQSLNATFTVAVLPDSPSGIDYVNCTASGTNAWVPTMQANSSGALLPHTWIIQAPAEFAIGEIEAPDPVYRGQANIPVDVEILNIGEAEGLVASIPMLFTLGSYTAIAPGEAMPVSIMGGNSKKIRVLVSIAEDTATGTSWLDAEVSGSDGNIGTPISAFGAAIPDQWTILAEKILTYSDATHLLPATKFVRPDSGTEKIFVKAENLAPLKEYAIRWYDTDGNEILAATNIGFSDPSGELVAEFSYDSTLPFGIYTAKLTNPVNTFSPAQTNFEIVTSAEMSGALQIPEKASVGQVFPVYLNVDNTGGATAEGVVPSHLIRAGTGTANYFSGPLPGSIDLNGYSQATFTWQYTAVASGTFHVEGHAYGFESGTGNLLSVPPGRALLFSQESFEEYLPGESLDGKNADSGWSGAWSAVPADQSIVAVDGSMSFTSAMGQTVEGGLRALRVSGNNDSMAVRHLGSSVSDQEVYVSMLMRFNGTQANNKFLALWFQENGYGVAPNIGIKMNRGNGSGVEDFFVRTSFNEEYSTDIVSGNTFFIVGRLSKVFGTGTYDQFELWVNPVNLLAPPAPDAVTSGLSTISSFSRVGIRSSFLTPGDEVDVAFIRLGKTWDSVVNDPLKSNVCLIQTPAVVTIDDLIATPTLVYYDQKAIEVSATLQNHGEADALIDQSELLMTPVFGSFSLASPSLPFVLPGNTVATWVFRVNINNGAPIGPATMTCRIRYADVNNPVPIIIQDKEFAWTIIDTRTFCSRASTFSSTQYVFNAGQIVYARCTGLPPNTALRIRFYESSDPDPPVGVGVAIPTPLNSGLEGQVDHSYQIPVDTDKLNQWMVVVDDGDETTLGTIYGTQYFEVVKPADWDVYLEIGSSTCFVGDEFAVNLVVNNISTWPTNVDHYFNNPINISGINRYYGNDLPIFDYGPGSIGSFTVPFPVYYPPRGPFVLTSGEKYTYSFILRAEADSGLTPDASASVRLLASRWRRRDLSTGSSWNLPVTDSINTIKIYRKALNLASDTWDFGVVEPGDQSIALISSLENTGNHQLEKVEISTVDLRKSVSEKIPGSYIEILPEMPLVIATEGTQLLETSILIPFHQPAGVYVATMAVYEDHNFSDALDAPEPHNLVMTRVEVPPVAKAMMVSDFVDLGIVAPGTDSAAQEIEFVGIGNLDLTDLKFSPLPGMTFDPAVFGPMAFDGHGTATIMVSIPAASLPGTFFATGTLFDDIPGGHSDEFTIKWQVGSQSLKVNPGIFALGLGTPTIEMPHYIGSIENTGELPLQRLKGFSTEFINIDQAYFVASDNIDLVSPILVDVGLSENSQAIVYVPGGTATGTYVATFTWFEDQNANSTIEGFEAQDKILASFTVEEFYRLYSLKQTEDFGGVRPDTSKLLTMGVRNAGSLPISQLAFEFGILTDGFDGYDPVNITLPAAVTNLYPGELRYFDLIAYAPEFHKHGTFIGPMTIYGDVNGNGILDIDEPQCQVELRIQIGDQIIEVVSPIIVSLNGTPASTTAAIFVTVQNTGTLAMSRVKCVAEDLIPVSPGPAIAASIFNYSPGTSLGSMVPGQSRTISMSATVPFAQTPGIYESTLWFWEDANGDDLRQIEETTASVPVILDVAYVKDLNASPGSINLGFRARGDIATASFIAQNIGNTSLSDVRWNIVSLLASSSSIAATNVSFNPSPIGFVATPPVGLPQNIASEITVNVPNSAGDAIYYASMVLYEDDFEPLLDAYNAGIEPFFALPVQLQVVTPFIDITPDPIVIPASDPVGQTASAAFTVTNNSLINYRNLRYQKGNLINGANVINAVNLVIEPVAFNSLSVGQNQAAEISVTLATYTQAPGLYEGTITFWDDRNNNSTIDPWETGVPVLVRLTVNDFPRLQLSPPSDPYDIGKVARNNFSEVATFSYQNTGNVTLTSLGWIKDDLFFGAFSIPAASISLDLTHNVLLPAQTGSVSVSLCSPLSRIAPDQELGIYGDALQRLVSAEGAEDSFRLRCEIIAGGPQGLDPGSVYQEVGSASFPIEPEAAKRYVLSAYINPGSGSAQLGFLLTDEVGVQIPGGYVGVDIASTGVITPVPAGTPVGIDDQISHYASASGEQQNWFRVFVAFDYRYSDSVASHSYILLQNTSSLTASHSIWIDGIQLENVETGVDVPTSWSEGKKIISPSLEKDLSGQRRYMQW